MERCSGYLKNCDNAATHGIYCLDCHNELVYNYKDYDDDDYEDECVDLELADTTISLSLSEYEIKVLRSADFPVELALKIANAILDVKVK